MNIQKMHLRKELMESFGEFVAVVEKLRSKEGCPWDRAQTHKSLRPTMIEEAYESVDAINAYEATGAYENLREELGDVLLQVVMHSVIAEEEALFTAEDVIRGITEKMRHRHPHVFGSREWNGAEHEKTWEELKAEEKAGKETAKHPLREIPAALPALLRASKVQKKSAGLYNTKEDACVSAGNLSVLAAELSELLEKKKTSGETETTAEADSGKEIETRILTEMLLKITNISWQIKINPEMALADRIEEIIADKCIAE
ncbi:MAG: MazG family protein [Lachnospiraceae bacterium]|nr:MazG family protein [Lachnospiraceae bacterium]